MFIKTRAKVNFSGPKISFPKFFLTFKIENMATQNCAKDWVKVAPTGLG